MRGGGGGAVLVLDESVVELTRHTDDHVVEVGVEVFSLGDFQSVGRFEMVTGHDVVDVVDTSGSHSNFGEVHGPHTSVGVLGLVLREVRRVDVVVNVSVLAIKYLSLSSHS